MLTPESLIALRARFQEWKEEVRRLLDTTNAITSIHTVRVEGYTWNQIQAMIDQEISNHAANRLAHEINLTALGGITRQEFLSLLEDRFPTIGWPLTEVSNVQWAQNPDGSIGVRDFEFFWQGRTLMCSGDLVANATRRYIRLTITYNAVENLTLTALSLSTDQTETIESFIIGTAQIVGGVQTATFFNVYRINNQTISTTPRGAGIPATLGSPDNTVVSLDNGWFAS